ncbi:hypothetical protein ACFQZT_32845 [Paenibacillus sp. GCM10027628]|uniref:hypothetical protein n=1 Tax=Paenibacillus sp. GCM10027628 TaxID=3273413 RepID=UPI00363EFB00
MKPQWKRRLKQTSLLAAMLTMSIGSAGGASAAESNANLEAQITSTIAQPAVKLTPAITLGVASSNLLPALQRNYFKLLASTYAPETVDAWKQALDERKQLESEMPHPQFPNKVVIMKKAEIDKSVDSGSETSTTERRMYRIVLPKPGTQIGTDQQIGEVTQSDAIKVSDDIIKAELPESFKRQQKLAEAVETDDAATIRSLLPELLKDYKNETEALRKAVKDLKDEAAKQPAQPAESTSPAAEQ